MKLVVGLSGKIGSGKTVVSSYLSEKYCAKNMRFSQILTDVLRRLHLPPERKTLQKLGHALRTSVGADVIVNAFRGDLEKESSELIVIDGIRYPNEVELLRGLGKNILIYVDAPPEVRYRRCVERNQKGEGKISFNEFMEAEQRETERHLDEISRDADYVIDNTGSIEELQNRIDEILREQTN